MLAIGGDVLRAATAAATRATRRTRTRSRPRTTSCWPCRSRARRFRRHRPRLRRLPDMNPRTTINCCLLLLVLFVPRAASAQGARLQLDHLDRLAEKAEETVDVTSMRRCSRRRRAFSRAKAPTRRKCSRCSQGITGIYVKSFEFNAPNAYTESDIEVIRKQAGRSRMVAHRRSSRKRAS